MITGKYDTIRNLRERYGIDFENIVLEDDDNCSFGGTNYEGETLGNFMRTIKINEDFNFIQLQIVLVENGIMAIDILSLV